MIAPCEVDVIDTWDMTIDARQARSATSFPESAAARRRNCATRKPLAAFAVELPGETLSGHPHAPPATSSR